MTIWNVLSDSERPSWVVTPLERVGPLAFGMTTEQVKVMAFEDLILKWVQNVSSELLHKDLKAIHFDLKSSAGVRLTQSVVVAYVSSEHGLAGVAVDARWGPQVTLGKIPLVGQTPSILQKRFGEYLMNLDEEIRYTHEANLCAPNLGVVLRAQRVGDLVLSRPVMVAGGWAENCWDGSEGSRVPRMDWNTFQVQKELRSDAGAEAALPPDRFTARYTNYARAGLRLKRGLSAGIMRLHTYSRLDQAARELRIEADWTAAV